MASPIFDSNFEDSNISAHTSSSAVLDGSSILRRYQMSRQLNGSLTSITRSPFGASKNEVSNNQGVFDACFDGNRLVMQYSAKKRSMIGVSAGNIDSPIFYNDTKAIDMIKNALIQLTNFQLYYSDQSEATENYIPRVIRLLRKVEDGLEIANISKDFSSSLEEENELFQSYVNKMPTKDLKSNSSVDYNNTDTEEIQRLVDEVSRYKHLLQITTNECDRLKVEFTLLSSTNYDQNDQNLNLNEAHNEINLLRSQISSQYIESHEKENDFLSTMNDLKESLRMKSEELHYVNSLLDNYKHVDYDQKRQIEVLHSQLVAMKPNLEAEVLHSNNMQKCNLLCEELNDAKECTKRLEFENKSLLLSIEEKNISFEKLQRELTESKIQYEAETDDLKRKFYSAAQQCDTLFIDLQVERTQNDSLEIANGSLNERICSLYATQSQSNKIGDSTTNLFDDITGKLMYEKEQMSIRESKLVADLSEMENRNKEFLLLLAAKDGEIALAEDVLKDIQNQFEEAKAHMHLKLEQTRIERSRIGGNRMEQTSTIVFGENNVRQDVENIIFDQSTYDNLMVNTVSMREMQSELYENMTTDISQAINHQEHQIKFQVSQLQALQDSVAEYKSSNAILKQHKKGLRDLSDTYKMKIDELENNLVKINDQNQNYICLLNQEILNHGKTKEVLISLQLEFSRKQEILNKFLHQNESLPFSSLLFNNQTETDKLKIECSKLRNRLEVKIQRLDETRVQVKELRDELDSRSALFVAGLKEKQENYLFNEVTHKHYEDFITLLEYKNNDLLLQLDEKDKLINEMNADYQLEKEVGVNLRDLLNKLGEKDNTTEYLLHVVQENRQELAYDLNEAINIINGKSVYLGVCDEEILILKNRELELRKQLRESEENRLITEKDDLNIKHRLSTIEDSSKVQFDVLNRHLDEMMLSKSQAEEFIQLQDHSMTQLCEELEGSKKQELEVQRALKNIFSILTKFDASIKESEKSQMRLILQKLGRLESRIQKASNNLIVAKRRGMTESSVQALEKNFTETKQSLSRAISNVTELMTEKNALVTKLNEIQIEHDYLETSYVESRNLQEMYEKSEENVTLMTQECKYLREQLIFTEQSLIEISAKNANDFAHSTESIVYLESECERMQQIVDHFKSVNINLTDNLKKSQDMVQESTSLRQHLISLQQSEESLIDTVKNMEAELKSKELDLLILQGNMQENQLALTREQEKEISIWDQNYKLLETKYLNLVQDFEAYKANVLDSKGLQNQEVALLQHTNCILSREKSALTNALDQCDSTHKSLKNRFDEKLEEINSLESRVKFEKENFSVALETYVKKIQVLESNIDDFFEDSKKSTSEINKLMHELNEIREELINKDKIIASNLEKQTLLKDDMRQCRIQLESYQNESIQLASLRDSLKSHNVDLQKKYDQLEDQYSNFRNNTYRTVILEAAQLEDELKQSSFELNSVKNAFTKCEEDLLNANNTLRLSESKVNELQSVIVRMQAKEYMISTDFESSQGEIKKLISQVMHFKSSHDESISELAQKSLELDNYLSKNTDLQNTIQMYVTEISALHNENSKLSLEITTQAANSNEAVLNLRSMLRKLGMTLKDANLLFDFLPLKTSFGADVFDAFSSTLPEDDFSVTLKSAISYLDLGIQNIDNIFKICYKMMEEFSRENSNLKSITNSLKNGLSDLENLRNNEKKLEHEKEMKMENDLFLRSKEHDDLKVSYQTIWNQLSTEKVENEELKEKNLILENNVEVMSLQYEELKMHTEKVSINCDTLSKRIKDLEAFNTQKDEDFRNLSDDYGSICKLSTDRDFEIERLRSQIDHIKADKDTADHVRHGLEFEIERLRLELNALKLNFRTDNSRFELEKMLVTMTSLFEQIPFLKSDNSTLLSFDENQGKSDQMISRVDIALRCFGDVCNWSRTEHRSRKVIEDSVDTMSAEISNLNSLVEKKSTQLSQANNVNSEKEVLLHQAALEKTFLQEKLNKAEDALQQLQEKYISITKIVGEEKEVSNNIRKNLLRSQSDLTKSESVREDLQTQISKLSQQLLASSEKQNTLSMECDRRDEQLRQSKINNARLSSTIENLEKGLDEDKQERDKLDKRLISAEVTFNAASRLKSQITDLEDILKQTRIDYQRELDSKMNLEIEFQKAKREVDGERRKRENLECLLDNSLKEKSILLHTISDLKQKHAVLKEQNDNEHILRLQADAELYYVRKPEQFSKIEDRHNDDSSINLNQLLEEKEKQRLTEYNARIKLEHDIQKLKTVLERANHELKLSSERGSSLRLAGRKSKGKIDDAVGRIRELINIVRSDAKSNGLSISISNSKSKDIFSPEYNKAGRIDSEVNSSEFLDALGLLELHDSLNSLHDIIVWLREFPQDRFHFEVIKSNLELEKQKLNRDLEVSTKSYTEKLTKLQLEMDKVKLEERDVQTLLDISKKEKSEKEAAHEEIQIMKQMVDRLNKEIQNSRNISSNFMQSHSIEESELVKLKSEVLKVSHQRDILRETVDKIENKVLTKVGNSFCTGGFQSFSGEENTSIHDVRRLQCKLYAMEELVNTYRSSVLSLCSDGEMRNALSNIKNPDLKAYANQQSSNRSWIEREIAIIKRSYDNEIHLLESEIKDLRSKLQQSLTFMSELRSRFEDNLKSLYKSNKDSDTDILIKEIERLNFSIETLEKSALMLRDQLSMEHQNSRTRHHKLIECLVETLQTKDAAIAAVQRIEEYCMQTGLDHVKEFSLLQTELDYTKKYSGHQSAERKNDIDLLLRSLIGVDHDSNEIERKSNISNNSVDICNAHDSFDNDDKLIKKFKSKANYSSPMKSGRDGNFPAEVMASKPFIVKHADNIFQSPTVKQTKSFKK